MKLEHQWQWDMLATALQELYDNKLLTSLDWVYKAKEKNLSTSELLFVITILLKRHLMSEEVK